MFKARGTKQVIGKLEPRPEPRIELDVAKPGVTLPADAIDIGVSIKVDPTGMPDLPADMAKLVRRAYGGDPYALAEMRRIGDSIPPDMQVAFTEIIEELLRENPE